MPTAFSKLENTILERRGPEEAVEIVDSLDTLNELKDMEGETAYYGDMIRYLLAVSNHFNEYGTATIPQSSSPVPRYAHIGGYAVLTHLVGQFGEEIIPRWRTSHDLDITVWDPSLDSVLRGWFEGSKRRSHIHQHKRSYDIKDPAAQVPTEVDFYMPNQSGIVHINDYPLAVDARRRARLIDVFGIPVSVVSRDDLLRLKLDIGDKKPRSKDVRDVSDVLSLYAATGESADMLVNLLFPNEQRKLANILTTRFENDDGLELTSTDAGVRRKTERFAQNFLRTYERDNPYTSR